jgi:hypothetical protein
MRLLNVQYYPVSVNSILLHGEVLKWMTNNIVGLLKGAAGTRGW